MTSPHACEAWLTLDYQNIPKYWAYIDKCAEGLREKGSHGTEAAEWRGIFERQQKVFGVSCLLSRISVGEECTNIFFADC